MIEFFKIHLTYFLLMVAEAVVIAMVISGIIKGMSAIFSRTTRKEVAARPVMHFLWFLASAACPVLLVFPLIHTMFFSSPMAHKTHAKSDVFHITAAMKVYHADKGVMLTNENAEIMKLLHGKGGKDTVYFELVPKQLNSAGEFVDPCKSPYRLGMSADGFAWAYSCGPDKKDDGGAVGSDDIASW